MVLGAYSTPGLPEQQGGGRDLFHPWFPGVLIKHCYAPGALISHVLDREGLPWSPNVLYIEGCHGHDVLYIEGLA